MPEARNRGLVRLLVRGVKKVKAIALWYAISQTTWCAGCGFAGQPWWCERGGNGSEREAEESRRRHNTQTPRRVTVLLKGLGQREVLRKHLVHPSN